jgi:CxxC motif-containing protein (DUF1111 family)
MRAVAVFALLVLGACQPLACGGGRGEVLSRDPDEVQRCRARTQPTVTPLFDAATPAETGPVVFTRGDGVRVTTIEGRVRGRHEREERFATYDIRSFENRSYTLVIEDAVPAGRSEVRVTYRPAADVSTFGPGTNFRHWKVYGPAGNMGGYTFAVNIGMTSMAPRELVQTVTQNVRESRALAAGDVLDFELGIYLAGADAMDPQPIPGGSAYFSDTFRYQVGAGGLTPENFDDAGVLGPPVAARLGGATTVPWVALAGGVAVAPEYGLSQLALNAQPPHAQRFLEGRRLFFTEFDTGDHLENGNPPVPFATPPLGPLSNAVACASCHRGNGRGVLPTEGAAVASLVFHLDASGAFGAQLQRQEAAVTLASREVVETVTLAGGETVTLTRPVFSGAPASASPRLTPPLVGLGLLESLDEAAVLANADEADCDGDGISGRASVVDGRLGRFGWKAEQPSLRAQLTVELEEQHGVTTAELTLDQRAQLETYVRLLGVLPQRDSVDPQVVEGEGLFRFAGCAACHLDALRTSARHPFVELRDQDVRPFTDLLLHDLGEGEWRTAPLWSLGVTRDVSGEVFLLHDGRARTVLEAVLWHGGEAQRSRDAVVAMSPGERAALVRFLESL